ncbi:adenylosuccinate synthetase [Metabacillus halosaccharovorans]|uniref:adenylosuccinate synthetase n=1 Tax=Metabacillus halosaccharovorans TaxID=930124 RepID=UPI001C1F8E98|nr:adenylosuccinate synthetase [Metabacillus halosaccharovorans]MBU7595699.1 adenylosuccinate synthetase [Metabacillus halosaccharovorans]
MVTVVIGGQIGSEGKGKVVGHIAFEHDMSIRTGGPNAGHTLFYQGHKYSMRMVPCAFINRNSLLAMAAGSVINPDVLIEEINRLNISKESIIVDPQAAIIENKHITFEESMLKNKVSTGSGVGAATIDKIIRKPGIKLAKDIEGLQSYIGNVSDKANDFINKNKKILIEGTQGFDLSVHHGNYPFVTSRDTTAATFCGEAGISPRMVKEIIMVLRTYPIRSSNGPLNDETTWNQVSENANSPTSIEEFTSVTKKIRRVGRFDFDLVEKSIMINRPTQLALNFIDYIDNDDYKVTKYSDLTIKSKKFIEELERRYGVPVTLIGTGPDEKDIIDLRSEKLINFYSEKSVSS